MALMAYIRIEDRGRFKGLLPCGGIGDGAKLPYYKRLRYDVQRLGGEADSSVARDQWLWDWNDQPTDLRTSVFATRSYSFREFWDEMEGFEAEEHEIWDDAIEGIEGDCEPVPDEGKG